MKWESKTRSKADCRVNAADAYALVASADGVTWYYLTLATASLLPCILLGRKNDRNVVVVGAVVGKPVLTVDKIVDLAVDTKLHDGAVVDSGTAGTPSDFASDFAFGSAVDDVDDVGEFLDIVLDPHVVLRSGPSVVVFRPRGCSRGCSRAVLQRWLGSRRSRCYCCCLCRRC